MNASLASGVGAAAGCEGAADSPFSAASAASNAASDDVGAGSLGLLFLARRPAGVLGAFELVEVEIDFLVPLFKCGFM